MKLIKDFLQVVEGTDETGLPEQTVKELQKLIRKGAMDLEQKWSNALHLVHEAYKVGRIQRPTPNMKAAWKQYEENIQFAVQQLSKTRGIDGNWRMSAASLHEEMENLQTFSIKIISEDGEEDAEMKAESINDILSVIRKDPRFEQYHINTKHVDEGANLYFVYKTSGIKSNLKLKIRPI